MSIERRPGGYRVRINRAGRSTRATFDTVEDARAYEAAFIAAAVHGRDAPEPPAAPIAAPAQVAIGPEHVFTVHTAARELVTGMRSGRVKDRSGRVYKPSTVREIEGRLRLHVLPIVGRLPVATLRRGDVRRMVEELEAGKGAAVARNALDALRLVLRRCVDLDVTDTNVCTQVRPPRGERRQPRVLTVPEARALQAACDAEGDPLGALVALAIGSGMRKGELLAVVWGPDGLDVGAGIVHVTRTRDALEGPVATKNRDSRRVPLGRDVVARMKRYRLAQEASQDGDLVFPGREPRAAWVAARTAAGLEDIRFHDLRRCAASYWRGAGLESHEVAALLGHRDGGKLAEAVYVRALPERLAGAGTLLEGFMAT